MNRLNRLYSPPYGYIRTPDNLGQGAEIYALVQPGLPPRSSSTNQRSLVRKQFQITSIGNPPANLQSLPVTDLRANGVYLSGQMELQALSDFQKGNEK